MNKAKYFLLAATLGLALAFTYGCDAAKEEDGLTDSRDGKKYKTVKIGEQTWMAENLSYKATGSKCYGEDGQVWVGMEWVDCGDCHENMQAKYAPLSDNEVQANCAKYGRLYDWATAMTLPPACNSSFCVSQIKPKHQGVCPIGWYLPSDDEWGALLKFVDGAKGGDGLEMGGCRMYADNITCYGSNTAGRHLKAISGWNDGNNGTDDYGFSILPGGSGYSGGSFFSGVGETTGWWNALEIDHADHAQYQLISDNSVFSTYDNKDHLRSIRCVKDN